MTRSTRTLQGMRRHLACLLIIAVALIAVGCDDGPSNAPAPPIGGSPATSRISVGHLNSTVSTFVAPSDAPHDAIGTTPGIDYDLTTLSKTMVFAQIYAMAIEPARYNGKTVRVRGTLTTYDDPDTNEKAFALIVTDLAGCCTQGFPLTLKDKADASRLPPPGTTIIASGRYATYQYGGATYGRLNEATVTTSS